MIALGLDDTGDLDFDPNTGVFNMVSDEDELAQKLSLLLGENLGEIPWNEDIGLDHQDIIANGDNRDAVESIISQYLEDQWPNNFGSVNITDFNFDSQHRLTSLTGTVTLSDENFVPFAVNETQDGDEGSDDDATNS